MKKPLFNPYLPPFEYIPDAEPRVFGDRLYVFGSHDRFGGKWYCENDYVTWSAPLSDLSDWRYEGVIYTKEQDAREGYLFAPDVVRAPDGRYYLFYSKDDSSVIGVASCDTPSGKYEFIGEVKYPDGRLLGGDENEFFMFDPSVLIDGDRIWLYSGSSVRPTSNGIRRNMAGCTVTELCSDMVTVRTPPKVVLPGSESWDDDIFFEGPSARKIGEKYYLVYPVRNCSGLHYAISESPDEGFVHCGTLISVSGVGIDGHSLSRPAYRVGNEHGGMAEINGRWYIFDHRQTGESEFCRQGIAEEISFDDEGFAKQARYTSGGLAGVLPSCGEFPAYTACVLKGEKKAPFITQSGEDGDENAEHFICDMEDGSTAGFRSFSFDGGKYTVKAAVRGSGGYFEIFSEEYGEPVGRTDFPESSEWQDVSSVCTIDSGNHGLFFTCHCGGKTDFLKFSVIKAQ